MDDVTSLEQRLPEVRFTSAKQLAKALKTGIPTLVTGPAGGTSGLLDEAAALLGASRTRVLRVRPPYPLSHFMHQVTPSTPDGHEDLLEDAFRALTVLDPSCDRIALLVEDAHLLPEATLRYIESSMRLGAHLCVALAGESKLLDTLALDSLAPMRKRLGLHVVIPGQVPAAPPCGALAASVAASVAASPVVKPAPFTTGALAPVFGPQPAYGAPATDGAGGGPDLALTGTLPRPARPRSFAPMYAVLLAFVCAGAVALELVGPSSRKPVDLAGAWTFTWPPRPWAADKAAPESMNAAAAPASPQPDTAYAAALPDSIGASAMSYPAPPTVPLPAAEPVTVAGADAAVPQRPDAVAADPGEAPHQAEAAPAQAGAEAVTAAKATRPEMAALPGGTFRMGSSKDELSERPTRSVMVAPFLMAKKAATVREWQQCVDAKACTAISKGRPDDPVTNVSWNDVRQFAAWLSQATGQPAGQAYRLPTEAEWEYAARAGTETRYSWGGAVGSGRAGCKGCGEPVSSQAPPRVDAYPPNPFGLYGMGGGVAEWVGDCWHRTYQGAPHDGTTAWDSANCRDRVLRGGSWLDDPGAIRVSSRGFSAATARLPTHGFRLAQSK